MDAAPHQSAALVVIPTYQERDNIRQILERTLVGAGRAVDVLVVDDGSPDGTAEVADDVSRATGRVHVLRRDGKQGLGSAYREGFSWGLARGYAVLIEMDADGSHDPAVIPELLRAVAAGADLAVGSRYVPGGATPGWARRRRLLSRMGNTYASLALGIGVRDATSGFRAYWAPALRGIDPASMSADGYAFQIEGAWRVYRAGGRITEVPITFVDRTAGASKMSGSIVREALSLVTRLAVEQRTRGLAVRTPAPARTEPAAVRP